MKVFKCLTHGTVMRIKEDKNGRGKRDINMSFDDLGCLLPSLEKPRETKMNRCNIVEVEDNG